MTPSLPCAKCGQIDDLETVNPRGILAAEVVLWDCPCGYPRAVAINHRTPQELVRKAIEADDMANTRDEDA
jgi:hypothetical protein